MMAPSLVFGAVNPRLKPSEALATELLKLPSEVRLDALLKQPDPIYDTLLQVAQKSENPMSLRWRAITSAALLRREAAAPDLMKLGESSDWFVRNASLVGLSEVAKPQAVTLARRLVKDPALVVRSAAVDVIAKNAAASERDLLWDEFHADYNKRGRQSLWIRGQILHVLAKHPKSTEQERFAGFLKDSNVDIQKASMVALEKITGLKVARDAASHERAVQLWQAHLSRLPSAAPQQ